MRAHYPGYWRWSWRPLRIVCGVVLLSACARSASAPVLSEPLRPVPGFTLTSSAFATGQPVPVRFTCDGEHRSPPLSWRGAPAGTRRFLLVVDDPDAPGGPFTHWLLLDLPAAATSLPEGVPATERLEDGAVQAHNDFGRVGYGGPCPPKGAPHHYRFTLVALDAPLNLTGSASKDAMRKALAGHILGEAQLVGTYQRATR